MGNFPSILAHHWLIVGNFLINGSSHSIDRIVPLATYGERWDDCSYRISEYGATIVPCSTNGRHSRRAAAWSPRSKAAQPLSKSYAYAGVVSSDSNTTCAGRKRFTTTAYHRSFLNKKRRLYVRCYPVRTLSPQPKIDQRRRPVSLAIKASINSY